MLARVLTATLFGLQPLKIEVEVDGVRGIPGFTLIGLPSKAVDEAKERVTAALTNCGVRIRSKRTIVNLAPADIHKQGSGFDLAIAIGILKMYGEVAAETDAVWFLGELALDGQLKPIRGALSLVLAAHGLGAKQVVVPTANLAELVLTPKVKVWGADNLMSVVRWLKGQDALTLFRDQPSLNLTVKQTAWPDVFGQVTAKRALVIAAAGHHHALMTGPPGTGKTELAKGMVNLLPELNATESVEVTELYSLCGLTHQLMTERPFRSPHHSISAAALLGGGPHLTPGEISLAHRGVLFLDELPEFNRAALESLRQPLETGTIQLTRAVGSVTYPAACQVIAAANPCPCGYLGSRTKLCSCPPGARDHYQKKLSGPLKDRFDLQVWVSDVATQDIPVTTASQTITKTNFGHPVIAAHHLQQKRWSGAQLYFNSQASWQQLLDLGQIQPASLTLLLNAYDHHHLSMRSALKILRVSRTIADLAQSSTVEENHVREALQYRLLSVP